MVVHVLDRLTLCHLRLQEPLATQQVANLVKGNRGSRLVLDLDHFARSETGQQPSLARPDLVSRLLLHSPGKNHLRHVVAACLAVLGLGGVLVLLVVVRLFIIVAILAALLLLLHLLFSSDGETC